MREIDPTHQGQLGKPEFIGILMESYAEDALQQYDDRLHHEASISVSRASPTSHGAGCPNLLWKFRGRVGSFPLRSSP